MNASRPSLWPWRARPAAVPEGTGTFGLALFFVSLGMLFLASIVGVLVVHLRMPTSTIRAEFPPVGWASTGALALVSLAMHRAVVSVRVDRKRRFQAWMVAALVASGAFITLQNRFWLELFAQEDALALTVESGFYAVLLLTTLHAAHVIGGLLWQGVVTVRALRNEYWSLHHAPVRGAALYWHFIDVVWVVLVAFLLWIR